MHRTDQYPLVFEALGIERAAFARESICRSAPIFRGRLSGRDIILKRTRGPLTTASALQRWSEGLAANAVRIVSRERLIKQNPAQVDDDVWVVYPFITGRRYSGSADDIRRAGRLLGVMHAKSPEVSSSGLPVFSLADSLPEAEGLAALQAVLTRYGIDDRDALVLRYQRAFNQLREQHQQTLAGANLTPVVGSWDFKANNLVYEGYGDPVLVDPDSAGVLPRVIDLALALVLFHNDESGAPGRMFTGEEWRVFRAAYSEEVALSDEERAAWPAAVQLMHFDEGLWLMVHDEAGWNGGRQREFLLNLLEADFREFVL